MFIVTPHQEPVLKGIGEWFYEIGSTFTGTKHEDSAFRRGLGLAGGQACVMGGFAGTGKSTLLPLVIEKMGLTPENVAFCAPTGKAAKVMGDKLRAFGIYQKPTTIHKLIYKPRGERADALEKQIARAESALHLASVENSTVTELRRISSPADLGEDGTKAYKKAGIEFLGDSKLSVIEVEGFLKVFRSMLAAEISKASGPKFMLKDSHDLPTKCRLIVVDEASMCGEEITDDLAALGLPILAMGDPGQLPPVNAAHGFSMDNPDFFLTEIHRQAKDNPIIHLATQARNGEQLVVHDYGDGVRVIARSQDKYTYDVEDDAMVIVGTHKKRWMVTGKIRQALGINQTGPALDEPITICRNSSKYPDLVNGSIVRNLRDMGNLVSGNAIIDMHVLEEDLGTEYEFKATQSLLEEHVFRSRNAYSALPEKAFRSKRNNEHVDFAHAITCHRAQGSQWDNVIVHDESPVFRENASRWLYTAITRAAERLTVVQ